MKVRKLNVTVVQIIARQKYVFAINIYFLDSSIFVNWFQSINYRDKDFPDGSRRKANNFCRNPNSDAGGPWCYVEEKSYEFVEKEYCDIPFCDNEGKYFFNRKIKTLQ